MWQGPSIQYFLFGRLTKELNGFFHLFDKHVKEQMTLEFLQIYFNNSPKPLVLLCLYFSLEVSAAHLIHSTEPHDLSIKI